MASGRKRLRPLPDTSLQDEDDFNQSNKFIRLRARTRAPTTTGKNTTGHSSGYHSSKNVTASSSQLHTANSASSSGVPRGKRNSGSREGGGGNFSKAGSLILGKLIEQKKGISNSKPFFSAGRSKEGGRRQQNQSTSKARPLKLYKKPAVGTPNNKKGKAPVTTFGLQTPEYMRVKEDESILQEKKERKRRKNKIMNLKTSKGQPVMRGRIELMLEEIKASTTKS